MTITRTERSRGLLDAAVQQIDRLTVFVCAANLLFPAGLLLYARLIGEDYWEMFWGGHGDAVTWFSSVQLLLVAAAAYANGQAGVLARRLSGDVPRHDRIWYVFAAGFAFLAVDEQFELHEALRDGWLRPNELFTDVPAVMPGDVVLYLYFAVGLVLAGVLVAQLRAHPRALALFAVAAALALATLVVDSLDERITDEWADGYFWTSVFEEIGEIWAQLLFLLSFLTVLKRRLKASQG